MRKIHVDGGAYLAQRPHLGSALSHFFLRDLQNLQVLGAFPRLDSALTACMMDQGDEKTANFGMKSVGL